MQAATDRRSHDDDRVPLDALIELTHADGGEVLEADAVDVSSGGLSLRAAFMPPVGARMQCRFSCPPHGDRVSADCEVVWSVLDGPHAGAFGVRFLALDTRSATLIRRLLEPDHMHVREVLSEVEPPAPVAAPATVASLHIDGLGAPIEADVRLDEQDHVLLTQELSFLRLGRGVRVEIEGAEQRRGRIASVTLEQVRSDTPALSLGVLIDAPEAASQASPATHASAAATVKAMPALLADEPADEGGSTASARAATDTWPESPLFGAATASAPAPEPEAARPPAEPHREPAAAPIDPHAELSTFQPSLAPPPVPQDEVRGEPASEGPGAEAHGQQAEEASSALALPGLSVLRGWLSPDALGGLRSRALEGWVRARDSAGERLPELRALLREWWDRLRLWLGSQAKRFEHFKRAQKKRRTTAPAPRASNVEARRSTQRPAAGRARRPGRGRFVVLGLLAFAGVAAAIYALAPRQADDTLNLHRRVQPEQPPIAQPAQAQPAPEPTVRGDAPQRAPEAEPPQVSDGKSFGAAEVPNGRTYSLRMSGAIERIEGEALREGFTVRVPGRLSLDRASPIATSHPALSRSLILNEGDRAELTIEFAPGKKPAYRVEAKGNNLEITVERL